MMKKFPRTAAHRIHIFGASGTGTTTLGQALGQRIKAKVFDMDNYYWKPTDPPFTQSRERHDRVRLLKADLPDGSWIISGSMCNWGQSFIPQLTLAVFLTLEQSIRLSRLHDRERNRFGDRIQPGGDMHITHREFIIWAKTYETAKAPIRSLSYHQEWLKTLPCSTIELNSTNPIEHLCDRIISELKLDPQ